MKHDLAYWPYHSFLYRIPKRKYHLLICSQWKDGDMLQVIKNPLYMLNIWYNHGYHVENQDLYKWNKIRLKNLIRWRCHSNTNLIEKSLLTDLTCCERSSLISYLIRMNVIFFSLNKPPEMQWLILNLKKAMLKLSIVSTNCLTDSSIVPSTDHVYNIEKKKLKSE